MFLKLGNCKCFACWLLMGCVLATGCSDVKSPKVVAALTSGLVCEDSIWDIGIIDGSQSPVLSHVFRLKNRSDHIITIKDVKTTCGCITTGKFDENLPAGKSFDLKVSVTISPLPGPIQKQVAIVTDADDSSMMLNISGVTKLNDTLYAMPQLIDFGTISQDATKERMVRIARYDKSSVNLEKVVCETDNLSTSPFTSNQKTGFTEFKLFFNTTGIPIGEYESEVLVICSHPKFKKLQVPFRATVIPKSK